MRLCIYAPTSANTHAHIYVLYENGHQANT